ncbi:MAG: hypothetical protein J3Q66DRAFT_367892 [Benniella sp.]|nr:MAG: hypothetical protein J3Q66DRAFT_367892 [Benniella sp.]
MPSRSLSTWSERVKSVFTTIHAPKGEQRQRATSAEKTTTKPTSWKTKTKKALNKLAWKKRTKAAETVPSSNAHIQRIECPLQATNHSQANTQDASSISSIVDECRALKTSNWTYQLSGVGYNYGRSAFEIPTNVHESDNDSDNDSLTDTFCEDEEDDADSFNHCRPSFKYRLHYGPLVENIENMFDEYKSLTCHETESAKLPEEQPAQELGSENERSTVQETHKDQQRPSIILPNPSDETLCDSPASALCCKTSYPVVVSSSPTPSSTRSIFLAPSLPKFFSTRVAPVAQDTTHGATAQDHTSERPHSISKAAGQRLYVIDRRIKPLEHSTFTKHAHQTHTVANEEQDQERHILEVGAKRGRQLNAKRLQLSRSKLFKECGINDQDEYDRHDIRSPHGFVETPRMTTFRNWLSRGEDKESTLGLGGRTIGRESRFWIPSNTDSSSDLVNKRASLLSMLSMQISTPTWGPHQRGSKPHRDIERTMTEGHERALVLVDSR